jgi:chromosome segregation ATPase
MKKKELKKQIRDLQYDKELLESNNQGLIEQVNELALEKETLENDNKDVKGKRYLQKLNTELRKEIKELKSKNREILVQLNQVAREINELDYQKRKNDQAVERLKTQNHQLWIELCQSKEVIVTYHKQLARALEIESKNKELEESNLVLHDIIGNRIDEDLKEFAAEVEEYGKDILEQIIVKGEAIGPKTPLQALEELRGIEPSEPVKGVLGESTQEQFEEFQKAFNGFMDQVHNPKNLMEILGLESTDFNGNPV